MQVYSVNITRNDAEIYKAISILIIATHNFVHWLPYAPGENEFEFNNNNFIQFIYLINNGNYFVALFSYYGHYFVLIFIFLSAYGLTKKYQSTNVNYRSFIRFRLVKLYIPFVITIIATIIVRLFIIIYTDPLYGLTANDFYYSVVSPIINGLLKIILISPFLVGYELSGVGPWWFIPFIMQFYLVFPILLKARNSKILILSISIAGVILTYLIDQMNAGLNLRFTPLGHMPEICLGIYLANNQINKFTVYLALTIAIPLFYLGCINEEIWYLNSITALIILLFMCKVIKDIIIKYKFLEIIFYFIALISIYIFLMNGVIREFYYLFISDTTDKITISITVMFSLLTTVLISYLLYKSEKSNFIVAVKDYVQKKLRLNIHKL